MLVKFKSDAGDVTMFGEPGVALLKMMGQSGGLPGALLAADIPAALEKLRRGVAAAPAAAPGGSTNDGDEEPKVSLRQRAWPLIELLERCVSMKCDLLWDEEKPLFRR